MTPLKSAREHAAKAVVAWILAAVAGTVLGLAFGSHLGWPTLDYSMTAEVFASEKVDDGVLVSYVGRHGGRVVAWRRLLDDSEWTVGQKVEQAAVDDDGNAHLEHQFGYAGWTFFLLAIVVAVFILDSLRRLWGLVIAVRDAGTPGDPPRAGYVVLIEDAIPKTWRPLLAIWDRDPVREKGLEPPDVVYRADDETGAHLKSLGKIRVMRAWIDTGRRGMNSKPRWVATDEGVIVPHRRSIGGGLLVRGMTQKRPIEGPRPFSSSPPQQGVPPLPLGPEPLGTPKHKFPLMFFGRLIATLLLVVIVGFFDDDGSPTWTTPAPLRSETADLRQVARDAFTEEPAEPPEALRSYAEHHGFEGGRHLTAQLDPQTTLELQDWRFSSSPGAAAFADAQMADWADPGTPRDGTVVAPLEGGETGTVTVLVADERVIWIVLASDRPRVAALHNLVDTLRGVDN